MPSHQISAEDFLADPRRMILFIIMLRKSFFQISITFFFAFKLPENIAIAGIQIEDTVFASEFGFDFGNEGDVIIVEAIAFFI